MPEHSPRSATAALELRGVRKSYGAELAVDDLDLRVGAGEFFALLGPSGCGKTTTLRLVAGLEEPDRGDILLGGSEVTALAADRRPVTTVFQNYALFPHLSVQANVEFGPRRHRVADPVARARSALGLVGLDGLGQRRPALLSGGQQQRVALARALAARPELLLLDEPLGALDLSLRRELQSELKRIQRETGLAFLHVTHDQEEAMTMADTVAVMNRGRIEQQGSPREVYERPRTAFVATFLGEATLLRGSIVGPGPDSTLDVTVGPSRLRVPHDGVAPAAGTEVVIAVRPERVSLAPVGGGVGGGSDDAVPLPAGVNRMGPGRVLSALYTGVGTRYEVEVPGFGRVSAAVPDVDGSAFAPGDAVVAEWAVARSVLVEP